MPILSRKTPVILLIGDVAAFVFALWATLAIRYLSVPDASLFYEHLYPFSYLFLIWIAVYFIAGLYERSAGLFRSAIPPIFLNVQLVNAAIAVGFFYFAPFSEIASDLTGTIAPKTNLFLYFAVSTLFILLWRAGIFRSIRIERRADAVLVGSGAEMRELEREVNANPHYHFTFSSSADLDALTPDSFKRDFLSKISSESRPIVVIDLYNEKTRSVLPDLYNLLLSRARFMDMHQVYEGVFGRVALSLLSHGWFVENISAYPKRVYDVTKRLMDFGIALALGLASLVLYPFVYIAIKLDDGGPVFIVQERVGKDNQVIRIPKFRSMRRSDKGAWVKENDDRITRVGKLLRRSRIDELPQLFSVVKGDLSLVGPRPDIYDLGMKLSREIPYYTMRTIIKPGLSGWAQIRQELPPQSLEETKTRLAYDFYYIKNRSLMLDLKIALQTIATLASRGGK
ncbi:MAG: sugar transferase [Candidatus Taylorbacteria bacterium]|nr:sugar transferase [Candidatus Taylorbacteria bacterium]